MALVIAAAGAMYLMPLRNVRPATA
jgi:hypothetical protein